MVVSVLLAAALGVCSPERPDIVDFSDERTGVCGRVTVRRVSNTYCLYMQDKENDTWYLLRPGHRYEVTDNCRFWVTPKAHLIVEERR